MILKLKRPVRLFPAGMALLILALSVIGNAQTPLLSSPIRIVVIKTRDIPFYVPAVKGLIDGLRSKGLGARKRIDFKVLALSGKTELDRALIAAQVNSKPDLIVTFGTDATRMTADQKPGTPVLFGMVLDPVQLGVVNSINAPGGVFTGTTIPVSAGKQMDALLQTVPRVRSIGLLYTDKDPTSLAFLADAQEDARRLHINLIAVPVPANLSARQALVRFDAPPDALWLLPDPASSGPQALRETLEYAQIHRLPVLGASNAVVRSGALLALSANLEDQGSSVAEMAAMILDGSELPANMRVRGPRRTILAVNLATAKRLGIAIPKAVLHLADEVVEADQEDK